MDETSLQKPWIVVHRHHYVSKSCPEFRRTVTFSKGMAYLQFLVHYNQGLVKKNLTWALCLMNISVSYYNTVV